MWNRDHELTIGRGETAESRIELPAFAAFIVAMCVVVFVLHVFVQNNQITIAAGVSLLVFGITLARVEFGIYILVVAMLLSPEIQAGSVGTHNERDLNLRYDDILIIVIFFGILAKSTFERRAHLFLPSPINSGIFAYYTVCIISTFLAYRRGVEAWDAPVAGFVMLKMLQFYMIFFMVGMAISSREDIRKQLTVFFVVAIIVSGYGIYTIGALDRVGAPLESGGTEPNTLGGYLLIVICVSAALAYGAPNQRIRIVMLAIAVVALFPFLQTLSRASYGALGAALLLMGILGRRFTLVMAVCGAFVFAEYLLPEEVVSRVQNTFDEGGEVVVVAGKETDLRVDKSTYERIYIWEKVRFNMTVWPWFGGGISWETVLDSQYARVLIETGILGGLAFAFLLFRLLRTTWQAHRWSGDWLISSLALGTFVSAIGLMIHSLGTISFLIVRIAEPFWFLVALTTVGRSLTLREHHALRRKARMEEERALTATGAPQPV